MRLLIFDTETTGLPIGRNPSILEKDAWPYIVQLSYILYDTETNIVIDYIDSIIKTPENISISKESENIHRISNSKMREFGLNIKTELKLFNEAITKCDIIIGHNISFDKRVVMVECLRNSIYQQFTVAQNRKPEFCTMKNSVNICKIPVINKKGEQYYKYPKLIELHKHLFNSVPNGLHNSMVDVIACLRCYIKIKNDLDVLEVSDSLKILNNMYKEGGTPSTPELRS